MGGVQVLASGCADSCGCQKPSSICRVGSPFSFRCNDELSIANYQIYNGWFSDIKTDCLALDSEAQRDK